jgi:hypothetical protein
MALLNPSNNNSRDKLRVDVYGIVCCIPSSIYGRKHTLDRPRRVAVALWHSMESLPVERYHHASLPRQPLRRSSGVSFSVVYDIFNCLAVDWLPRQLFSIQYTLSSCCYVCFACTDRLKTNLSFPASLMCRRQSLQKAESSEKIPAASDEIKKGVLEQRRAIILAIIGATPDSSPSLERVLSNDYLSGVKVWLDQVLDGSVGKLRVTPISTSVDSVVLVRVFLSMLFFLSLL